MDQTSSQVYIFVHGLLGYSDIRFGQKSIQYFRNLGQTLSKAGYRCYFPKLPPVSSIIDRARALSQFMKAVDHSNIYLIAHSMGGLDSRYLIHHFDPKQHIRGLVTIGTPHRGSPLASLYLESKMPFQWIIRGITLRALQELTPSACIQFNEKIPNRSNVHYYSYAGVRMLNEMPLWFRPWTRMLDCTTGDNDSQVPLTSARWGQFKGVLRADHLELAGWNLGFPNLQKQRPFDHITFYHSLLAALDKGQPLPYLRRLQGLGDHSGKSG